MTQQVDERNLIRQCAEKLPSIALPKGFVVIPELPKMGSGKIDFRGVAEMVKQEIKKRSS